MAMTLEEILTSQRQIWGDRQMSREEIVIALGVVYGDLCRIIRDKNEGKALNDREFKKEFGNLLNSTVRWLSDLDYSPEECLELSNEAHRKYSQKKVETNGQSPS